MEYYIEAEEKFMAVQYLRFCVEADSPEEAARKAEDERIAREKAEAEEKARIEEDERKRKEEEERMASEKAAEEQASALRHRRVHHLVHRKLYDHSLLRKLPH